MSTSSAEDKILQLQKENSSLKAKLKRARSALDDLRKDKQLLSSKLVKLMGLPNAAPLTSEISITLSDPSDIEDDIENAEKRHEIIKELQRLRQPEPTLNKDGANQLLDSSPMLSQSNISPFLLYNINANSVTATTNGQDSSKVGTNDKKGAVGAATLSKAGSRRTAENRVRKFKPTTTNPDGTITVMAKYGPVTIVDLGTVNYENLQCILLTLLNIGVVQTDRYIYPVNFHTTRKYSSTVDVSKEDTTYHSKILDIEGVAFFEVTADDRPDKTWTSRTSSGAWGQVISDITKINGKIHSSTTSGPDFYGLTCPEIAKLIQELPNASLCSKYKWQTFIPATRLIAKPAAPNAEEKDLQIVNEVVEESDDESEQ